MGNKLFYSFNNYDDTTIFNIGANSKFPSEKKNNELLKKWQHKCLIFWNLFYSLLLVADADIVIMNQNFESVLDLSKDFYLSGKIIELLDDNIQKQTIAQIFAQTQHFQLNGEVYSLPQNFLYLSYDTDNNDIDLYYPCLGDKLESKSTTEENSDEEKTNEMQVIMKKADRTINIINFFDSQNQSKNFLINNDVLQQRITKYAELNKIELEEIFNIYLTLIEKTTMNLISSGIYFSKEIFTLGNGLFAEANNIQNISNEITAALTYQDIQNIKSGVSSNLNITVSTKNYLTYPLKNLRITQTYEGATSHLRHLKGGNPIDYSIDEGGAAGVDQEPVYCPCDELEVIKNYGVGNGGVNTVWFKSTSPVLLANGSSDYVTIEFIHSNDADFKNGRLDAGKRFKRGELLLHTGWNGLSSSSADHTHIAVGLGMPKDPSSCWSGKIVNGESVYVLDTVGGPIKPEEAFWIDKNFTKVINTQGLNFKTLT